MSTIRIKRNDNLYTVSASAGDAIDVEIPWRIDGISEVESFTIDNVMPYLTSMEADLAMLQWFDLLEVNGQIRIHVPDADYFMRKWLEAQWTDSSIRDAQSEARLSFHGLFGPQQHGNPRDSHYNAANPGVYKSAYNSARLRLLLERAGFCHIKEVPGASGELIMTGKKTMMRGERQIASTLSGIRPDHLNRYEFATTHLLGKSLRSVLDCACGIGYGSHMLAQQLNIPVRAIDIDAGAIEHAKTHFNHPLVDYELADARTVDLPSESVDAIISFETIEHIDFAPELLRLFASALTQDGYFICSTPNESVMPFSKDAFPYHLKHYTVNEFYQLVEQAGFSVEGVFQQQDPQGGKVEEGCEGAFTILVCKKR